MIFAAEQRVDGLVQADVAQRNRGAAVLEDVGDVVVGLEPHTQAPSMYKIGATRALMPSSRAMRVIRAFFASCRR